LYRYAHVTHGNVSIKKIQEELHHNYSRTLIMQIYSKRERIRMDAIY